MDHLLVHKCTIQTRTNTPNTFGEPVYSWSDTYTNVPCRFTSQKGSLFRLSSGEFVTDTHELFLKNTQTISEDNRVVGTAGFVGTYEVLKVKNVYDSHKSHHLELDIREVVS